MKMNKNLMNLLNIEGDAKPKTPVVIQDIPEHKLTDSELHQKRVDQLAKKRVESKPVPKVEPLTESRKEQLANGWIKAKLTRGNQQWKYFTQGEWDQKPPHEKMKYVIDATPVPGNLKTKVVRGGRRTKVFSSLN